MEVDENRQHAICQGASLKVTVARQFFVNSQKFLTYKITNDPPANFHYFYKA